jgi:hypothetical protein
VTDVDRTHDAEVASVKRGELRFSQSFHAGQDGRVDESERQVGILLDKGGGACEFGWVREMYLETSSLDISHQAGESAVPGSKLIFDLDERAHGDDPDFGRCVDQLAAALVSGIAAVDEREEGAGVKDQRQASG